MATPWDSLPVLLWRDVGRWVAHELVTLRPRRPPLMTPFFRDQMSQFCDQISIGSHQNAVADRFRSMWWNDWFSNSATKAPMWRHNQFCKVCYVGLISSFEPMTTCHMALRKLGSIGDGAHGFCPHVCCMGLLFVLAIGGCWLLDCSSASDNETIH